MQYARHFILCLLMMVIGANVIVQSAMPVALVASQVGQSRPASYFDYWHPLFEEVEPIHVTVDLAPQKLLNMLIADNQLDLIFDRVDQLREYAGVGLLRSLGTAEEVTATLNVGRENLVLVNGEVIGLQIPWNHRIVALSPLGVESVRWGVARVDRSKRDTEGGRIIRMAADLLRGVPVLDDYEYQAMYRFIEYLLMMRDPQSALVYVYPPFRDDAGTWEYYRNRLHAIALRSQIAQRGGVWHMTPQGALPDFGTERLDTWHHPITNEAYVNVTAWLAEVLTPDRIWFTVPVYTIEHEGAWHILHVGDVL